MKGDPHGQRGMMLLDLIVGSAILAAAVLSTSQIVMDTTSLNASLTIKQLVVEAMDREFKAVESTPFDDLIAVHDGRGFAVEAGEGSDLRLTAVPGDPDGLPGRVTVTAPPPPDEREGLVDITVEIAWTDPRGEHSMVRRLRVSRAGGYDLTEYDI